MKSPARITLFSLLALMVIGAAFLFLRPREIEVATVQLSAGTAERGLAVNGRIRPRLQVNVRPQIGGALIALPFDVGDHVTAGQIIARIDDAPERAAIAEAQASAATQVATLAQARRDYARFAALGEFVSKRDLEQRRLAVVEGERELSRRRAAVVQSQETQDRRVLRAPFAGVILERPVDPGQTVGVDSIVYRLADLHNPEISVEVDEVYAAEVRNGMTARISLPAQSQQLEASIVHVEPRVDPTTGARNVRLRMTEAVNNLPSGLTVTVNLLIERRTNALQIPRSAIIEENGVSIAKVVSASGTVNSRPIQFLEWPSENVIITSGLQAGDHVMLQPDQAKAGDVVRIAAQR